MSTEHDQDHWLTLDYACTSSLQPSDGKTNCAPETAALLAAMLFGFYRASEANDPDIFIHGVTAVLSHYPEKIAREVCDPVRGIPSQSKWLPSIAEIRVACDIKMIPIRQEEERQDRRRHTEMVLSDRYIPDTERERVKQGFRRLQASLNDKRQELDARKARTPEERERAMRHHEGHISAQVAEYAIKPLTISDELAKIMRHDLGP